MIYKLQKLFSSFFIIYSFLFFFTSISYAKLANTAWPTASHDMVRTGRTTAIGPSKPKIKWRTSPVIQNHWGSEMRGITIGNDGRIYASAAYAGLAALDKNTGQKLWENHMDKYVGPGPGGQEAWHEYPPTIGADGILYTPTEFGWMSAFDTNGNFKYVVESGKTEQATAMDTDTVYFFSWSGLMYAYRTDIAGTGKDQTKQRRKWTYRIRSQGSLMTYGLPAVGSDGTIYIAWNGIYAFYTDVRCAGIDPLTHCEQQKKWSVDIPQAGQAFGFYGPVIDEQRRQMYYTNGQYLYAVNMDTHAIVRHPGCGSGCADKWLFNFASDSRGRVPALGIDGMIFVGADSGFYALQPDGTLKWKAKRPDNTYIGRTEGNAIVDGNGTVYVWAEGETEHKLYALDPATGKTKPNYPIYTGPATIGNFQDQAIAMDSDGTIYLPSGKNEIMAIGQDGPTMATPTPTPTPRPTSTVPTNTPIPTSTPTPTSPSVTPSGLIGDIVAPHNAVDILDYNAVVADFGQIGSGIASDIIQNGMVDIFDYNAVVSNFGRVLVMKTYS